MRLLHVTTLRLSLLAAVLLTFWSVLFYFVIMDEVNDEVDDSLEDYAEMIILRSLRGETLPKSSNGTNNQYYLHEVPKSYADTVSHVEYSDREIYIEAKEEIEPARVLTYIYMRADGQYMELVVATPSIDKSDLQEAIAFWIIVLYGMLMLSMVLGNLWGIRRTMRPLKLLLDWMDQYRLGQKNQPLNNPTRIWEFRRLNESASRSMKRGEEMYEQQKIFIGNASHEMQTPIAACQNRIEMLLEDEELTENQMGELIKVNRTLRQLSKLNKSLLLLCKIENGQYAEDIPQNFEEKLKSILPDFEAVYASRQIEVSFRVQSAFCVNMDDLLVGMLLSNLLKNAYVHNLKKGKIEISMASNAMSIANSAANGPLDVDRIFQRFYHTAGLESSTGLGLSLVQAICNRYQLKIKYKYENQMHVFEIAQ